MGIEVEKKKTVWTIIIDNPKVRNAVKGPTASALTNAFWDFEAEEEVNVAVLCGAHGCFCSGANMKKIHEGLGNRIELEMVLWDLLG